MGKRFSNISPFFPQLYVCRYLGPPTVKSPNFVIGYYSNLGVHAKKAFGAADVKFLVVLSKNKKIEKLANIYAWWARYFIKETVVNPLTHRA